MKILAFETSSSLCSVALLDEGLTSNQPVQMLAKNAPKQHAQLILPMIQTLLQESGLTFSQLDAITFGCGPGSFTGIRIATSVAQGIGFAANLPIIPISSLAVLAQTTYDQYKWSILLTAVDAHAGKVYFATYVAKNSGLVELMGNEAACLPNEVKLSNDCLQQWEYSAAVGCDNASVTKQFNTEIAGTGNAWQRYSDVMTEGLGFKPTFIDSSVLPYAKAILKLAKVRYQAKAWVDAAKLTPSYLT